MAKLASCLLGSRPYPCCPPALSLNIQLGAPSSYQKALPPAEVLGLLLTHRLLCSTGQKPSLPPAGSVPEMQMLETKELHSAERAKQLRLPRGPEKRELV